MRNKRLMGTCILTLLCIDGVACTDSDQITAGSCGGTAVDCSGAGDQCNTASCDPVGAEGNCNTLTAVVDGAPN